MTAAVTSLLPLLLRGAVGVALSAAAAQGLLRIMRVASPRVHRAAWLLVLCQGWLVAIVPFAGWTLQLQAPAVRIAPPPVTWIEAAPPHAAPTPTRELATQGPPPVHSPLRSWSEVFLTALAAAWALGLAATGGAYLWRVARVRRLVPLGRAPEPGAWRDEWRTALAELPRPVRAQLRITEWLGPLLYYSRPRYLVLAPRGLWSSLAPQQRLAILRHELAHLQRGDLWKSLAVRVLALPQWFNPIAWLAVRRFDQAAEWACDDLAAGRSEASRLAYAQAIVTAAAGHPTHLGAPVGAMAASGGKLSCRVRRVLSPHVMEDNVMRRVTVLSVLALMAALGLVRIEQVAADDAVLAAPPAAEFANEPTPAHGLGEFRWTFPTEYVIEPPDILLINAVELAPKAEHKVEAFDGLLVRVLGVHKESPIGDVYYVEPEGYIHLGPTYGKVSVDGLTIAGAQDAIKRHLAKQFAEPKVTASLAVVAGIQQFVGDHLVTPDGAVDIGDYGAVPVAGLTIDEAKARIEQHLAKYFMEPEMEVKVLASNSKRCYIIDKVNGVGSVTTVPVTGEETVLDALNQYGPKPSPRHQIWVARPAPSGQGADQTLPVNFAAIIANPQSDTNYQLLPGDRLFVETMSLYHTQMLFVEDPSGSLEEFPDLKAGRPMVQETEAIDATVRILINNKLCEVLSRPQIMSRGGEPAAVSVGGPTTFSKAAIVVGPDASHTDAASVKLETTITSSVRSDGDAPSNEPEQSSAAGSPAITVLAGQSVLQRLTHAESGELSDIYVVVTPQAIDELPKPVNNAAIPAPRLSTPPTPAKPSYYTK